MPVSKDISEAPEFSPSSLARWTGGKWSPVAPGVLKGVCTDSRETGPGSLFVALSGDRFDGHDYVDTAFARGAAGAVVREGGPVCGLENKPVLSVGDTLEALQAMALGYRKENGTKVIAVTGSAGKTTVKELVASVMQSGVSTWRTPGNLNNHIGVPLSLLRMPRDTAAGIFEAGINHPGEMAPLCRMLKPDWGIVTNIGPVHMEFFDSVRAIAAEKAVLLDSLPSSGTAVLCRDGEYFDVLKRHVNGHLITVSTVGGADYVGRSTSSDGCFTVTESASGERFECKLPLPGEHQVCNALFAIAVGRAHGIGWDKIRSALENYKTLSLRWDRSVVNGVTVINDAYNANPLSMRAAITAFSGIEHGGRKWLVLGGMMELGEASDRMHAELGEFVARGGWSGIITVGPHGALIAESAAKAGMSRSSVIKCDTHAAAAKALAELAVRGDAVLLKASRSVHLEDVKREYALLSV